MKYCFGIDVGGTTVKMGLFEKEEFWLINGKLKRTLQMEERIFFQIL